MEVEVHLRPYRWLQRCFVRHGAAKHHPDNLLIVRCAFWRIDGTFSSDSRSCLCDRLTDDREMDSPFFGLPFFRGLPAPLLYPPPSPSWVLSLQVELVHGLADKWRIPLAFLKHTVCVKRPQCVVNAVQIRLGVIHPEHPDGQLPDRHND